MLRFSLRVIRIDGIRKESINAGKQIEMFRTRSEEGWCSSWGRRYLEGSH